jgi:hypothetical protein
MLTVGRFLLFLIILSAISIHQASGIEIDYFSLNLKRYEKDIYVCGFTKLLDFSMQGKG